MKESFWKGDGKNAWTAKAVISPTGHVIAKNYAAEDLHVGDLGITLRLDRRLDGFTPEQRLAAQGILEAAYRDAMRALGKEEIEGSGIPIGSFVELRYGTRHEVYGYFHGVFRLERETHTGLHLRALAEGSLRTTTFFPWTAIIEVTPVSEDASVDKSFMKRVFKQGEHSCLPSTSEEVRLRIFASFMGEWGEDALVRFFIASPVEQGRDPFNDGFRDRKDQPWLLPALRVLNNSANLERVAKEAQHPKVREAAATVLAERQADKEAAG